MDKNLAQHILMSTKAEKAELVFKNCKLINVLSSKIEKCDIAVSQGMIVGVGNYNAENTIDLNGAYVCPGLIDSHLHIESTMLSPANFAKAVLPHGVTTCIADPHEIANVCGEAGIRYMLKEAATVPMDIKIMMPSCVPTTLTENNGAVLDEKITDKLLAEDDIFGLGEFMNSSAVCTADKTALAKLCSATARNKPIDGHLVNTDEQSVNAYVLAGIFTDHENIKPKSAQLKIDRGMYVMVREGTSTRNLTALKSIFKKGNWRRLLLCTDDKQVCDLKTRGHLDNNIRMLVNFGKRIEDVLTVATLNAAECFGLKDRGAICCGKRADFVVFDNPKNFVAREVYVKGRLVAQNGKAIFEGHSQPDSAVLNTMHADKILPKDLELLIKGSQAKVMRIMPDNVVTFQKIRNVNKIDGKYAYTEGINKICVVERHKHTGNIGIGLIEGYGVKNGALALSVAHDSHNIIAVGDNDQDIAMAVNQIVDCGGGWCLISKGKVIGKMPLVIGGIMSDKDEEWVYKNTAKMVEDAHNILGVSEKYEPFMSLSFMSLVVIPELKITDRGLFDVAKFDFTDINP